MRAFLEKLNTFKTANSILIEFNNSSDIKISKREFNKLLKSSISENIINDSIIENNNKLYISNSFIDSISTSVENHYLSTINNKVIDISNYFNCADAIIECDILHKMNI